MISMHTKHKTFVRCFTFLFSSKSSKPRVHVPLRAQRRSLSHISNSLATHSCGRRIEKVTFNFDNVWPYEVLPTLRSVLGSLKDNAGWGRRNYNSSCPSPGRASTSSPRSLLSFYSLLIPTQPACPLTSDVALVRALTWSMTTAPNSAPHLQSLLIFTSSPISFYLRHLLNHLPTLVSSLEKICLNPNSRKSDSGRVPQSWIDVFQREHELDPESLFLLFSPAQMKGT